MTFSGQQTFSAPPPRCVPRCPGIHLLLSVQGRIVRPNILAPELHRGVLGRVAFTLGGKWPKKNTVFWRSSWFLGLLKNAGEVSNYDYDVLSKI